MMWHFFDRQRLAGRKCHQEHNMGSEMTADLERYSGGRF